MSTRGEKWFSRCPGFAARLYDRMTYGPGGRQYIGDMADRLAAIRTGGRLLEVGFGPGRLLHDLHLRLPAIELFGIDVSTAMVELAKKNLAGVRVNLKQGRIEKTDYPDENFDLVTCSGSFYLWDDPQAALREIRRILKNDGQAVFFEIHRDHDRGEFKAGVRLATKDEPWLKRRIAPFAFRKAIRMAYSEEEFREIFSRSPFAAHFQLERISLGKLPIWLQITLKKSGSALHSPVNSGGRFSKKARMPSW